MTKERVALLVSVRQGLEEIPARTYGETNLKLGMMQALDQIIRQERADDDDSAGGRDGDR